MLTPAEKSSLDYHLRETNLLTNEELILELTDHYTTVLCERMVQGMTIETALTDTQYAFGGRKGLQKMERQYNRVTFRHDERWRQALINQFQKPLLWKQTIPAYAVMLLASFFFLQPDPLTSPKWTNFYEGFIPGFLGAILIMGIGNLWPYLKVTFQRGIHNIPTETLYLLSRQCLFMSILLTVGTLGYFWLIPMLNAPIQAILVATYLAGLTLFTVTSHYMQELLYEYEPNR